MIRQTTLLAMLKFIFRMGRYMLRMLRIHAQDAPIASCIVQRLINSFLVYFVYCIYGKIWNKYGATRIDQQELCTEGRHF